MKKEKYWESIIVISAGDKWIDNEDFRIRTHGSPKFTSRVSDMKKKGVEFEDRWVCNTEDGRPHKQYRLITEPKRVRILMTRRKTA